MPTPRLQRASTLNTQHLLCLAHIPDTLTDRSSCFSRVDLQLYAEPSMIHWLKNNYKVEDLIIVSPDAGGAKRYVPLSFSKLSYPSCIEIVQTLTKG